ncbi:hypothetical protein L1887_35999 [Cichorium endivia]|nr:hypothetical protein L1887_35999 [Cichorium endivia]
MGAFLLARGTKGKRFCMPNSRVMIHQPLGKARGNVEADMDRDYFMNAWEAKAYRLVDEVIDDGKPSLVAPIADTNPPPKTPNGHVGGGEDGDEKKEEESVST